MPAFRKVPFFFKPMYSTPTGGQTKLVFDYPSDTSKIVKSTIKTGLQSIIYFSVGKVKALDGRRCTYLHEDEIGKDELNDTWKRHTVNKKTLFEKGGMKIIGYKSATSTSGEMLSGGGSNFEKICKMSNFYQRNEIGQTPSGLCVLWISSTKGLNTDKYGISNVEENKNIIESNRRLLLANGDLAGWNQEIRDFPIYYRECFMTSSSEMGFNIYKIEQRLADLKVQPVARRGKFVDSQSGNIHSDVVWRDDPNGFFEISLELPEGKANRRFMLNGQYYPTNGMMFTAGTDPYRMNKTEGTVQSFGGGYVFWERDKSIDPDNKDVSEWVSHRTVCTYLGRPLTTEEYCMDMLRMCKYYGSLMSSETNISHVIDNFTKWGYGGYLMYYLDDKGYPRKTPGMHAGANSEQIGLQYVANYIELHCHRENHIGFLQQAKEIPGVAFLTKYDMLAAAVQAHTGSEKGYRSYIDVIGKDEKSKSDIGIFYKR
jgi:hypothetical protein